MAESQAAESLPARLTYALSPSSLGRTEELFLPFSAIGQFAGLRQSHLTKRAGYSTDFQMVAFDNRFSKSLLGRVDLHVVSNRTNILYAHSNGFFIHFQMRSDQLAVFFIGFSEAEARATVVKFRAQYESARLDPPMLNRAMPLLSIFLNSAKASETAMARGEDPRQSKSDSYDYAFDSSLQSCPGLEPPKEGDGTQDERTPSIVWERAFQQWGNIKDSILKFEKKARDKNKNFTNLPSARKTDLFCQNQERKICEARWKQRQCNDLFKTATAEDRKHFFSCDNANDLAEITHQKTAPLLLACGAGIGGAYVDATLGVILLPQAVWKTLSSLPQKKLNAPECSKDRNAKLALLGSLRPQEMEDVSIDRMSCGEIRKFARSKADTVLLQLQERRLAEATRTGNENLTIYDLKLSDSEIQALNYDMSHAGPLRKAQCYRPAEAAQSACRILTGSLAAVTSASGLAKIAKKISSPAKVVRGEAGISAPVGPSGKINATGKAAAEISNSSRAKNSIVIGVPDPVAVEKFNKAPKWDGSVEIPKNMSAKYSFETSLDRTRHEMKFETGSIEDQSKEMRNLLRDIRKRSNVDKPDSSKEIEMGAIIVEYQNGKSQVLKLTSDEISTIRSVDHEKAISQSGILKGFSPVKRIVHVHTHPRPDNPKLGGTMHTIAPSFGDYEFLEKLKNTIESKRGRKIEIEGIVVPSCQNCKDLLLHYRPEWDTTRPY